MKYIFYLLLLLSISSCRTVRTVPVETVRTTLKTDTLYINNDQYDSIYVFQDKYIDRSKDTVLIRQHDIEFRYKLLRDTIYNTRLEIKRDSIPYEVKVIETKETKYIPPWCKLLAWTGAGAIGISVIFLIFSFSRKFLQFITTPQRSGNFNSV